MKLKELIGQLEGVKTWRQPKSELEQYPTPPDIAAHMLFSADAQDSLDDALVADLGCGGGVLGIGAAMMGASHVVAVDIDSQALEVAAENVAEFEVPVDLVCCDVLQLSLRKQALGAVGSADGATATESRWTGLFDVVLMNPPFGTRPDNNGMDVAFLRVGLALCRPGGSLYTLHKTATRAFIGKTAAELGAASEVVAELKFEIPRMYKHHRKACVDVDVDFWRISATDHRDPYPPV
eukprot:scaffold6226_cov117-Isochrysis_galbana.AAC.5